jgi:hypothetical protein
MALALSVVRGPLPDRDLDAIAATYGARDARYAQRRFLSTLFNENPFGFSVHAFVRDGSEVVGHYAVIPMRVRTRGGTVMSGKGEALFLAERHRKTAVATEAGEALPGIAMLNAVHERALSDGIAFIHSITNPGVGILLRMMGFRALRLDRSERQFLPHAGPGRRLRSRASAWRAVSAGQRLLLAGARGWLRATSGPAVEIDSPANADFHLEALAATAPTNAASWSISRDLETLRWMRRLGRLQFVSIAGEPDRFACVRTGHTRELLLWSVPPGDRRSSLAILCALLAASVRDGARSVSVPRRLSSSEDASLRNSLRRLGFLPRAIPITLYVKSRDPFYLEAGNVAFDRLFNL